MFYAILSYDTLPVDHCEVCQHMNAKVTTERPQLFPIPVKSPMYHVGIDFVGPISPTTKNGNLFILTMTDYFTKYGWAKALPSKEATNVVSSLKEVNKSQFGLSCFVFQYNWLI